MTNINVCDILLASKIGTIPILERQRKMEKYSRQRQEILDFLIESYSHPTAEEVYNEMKKRGSTASKGTVYRNLNFLTDKGIIEKISIQNGADRYDYLKTPHNHAICVKCNTVFDFEYNFNAKKLKKTIKEKTNIEKFSNYIIVQGICKKCLENQNF